MMPHTSRPCAQTRSSNPHVPEPRLNVVRMSDTIGWSMASSADASIASWAFGFLHRHSTLADSERMAVDAAIPVASTSELCSHGCEYHVHLRPVGAAFDHFANVKDLSRTAAC